MGYRLGVDLGMTYTSAAVAAGGLAEVLRLGSRGTQVPSVLFVRDDGGILVGEAAERQGSIDPTRVVREFKRRIGDPVPMVVAGSSYSAQALLAQLLAHVVGIATRRQGGPPEHVCVTHPAGWGPFKLDLLRQAIELAGLGGVSTSTCPEPEAAAIAYAVRDRVVDGDRIAVYDLGGGTFDAAVLLRDSTGFRRVGPPIEVEHLGGVHFDEAILRHALSALGADVLADLDDADPAVVAAMARLRRDCVEAKEVLSSDVDTAVVAALPGTTRSVRLTRGELNDMLRPAIAETVAALHQVLDAARVAPEELSAIVMVGGSSRIPLVSQLVSAEFRRPLALDIHPEHDIALGAALRGAPSAGPGTDRPVVPGAGRGATTVPPIPVPRVPVPRVPVPPAGVAPVTGEAAGWPTAAVDPRVATGRRPGYGGGVGPPPARPPRPAGGPPNRPDLGAAGRRRRPGRPALLVGALLAVAAVFAVVSVLANPPWAQVVYREAANTAGAFPGFVPGAGPGDTQVVPPMRDVAAITGDTPGLYGGTEGDTCDAKGMATYLAANPAKAQAWAAALGLAPADIAPFLGSLTPVTLRTDTAVTNHGFQDGRAIPFQSVLQAGTAVLIDPLGMPRVRCYCGNPLGEPDRQSVVRYADPAWDGFSADAITVISRAPAEVDDFVVITPGKHEIVARPRGTSGDQDRPADPAVVVEVAQTLGVEAANADGDAGPDLLPPPGTPEAGAPATTDPSTVPAATTTESTLLDVGTGAGTGGIPETTTVVPDQGGGSGTAPSTVQVDPSAPAPGGSPGPSVVVEPGAGGPTESAPEAGGG